MSGTMGRMYIGTSGIMAHQNAINTTAHNLTNVNTKGYSRQQVVLSDVGYQTIGYTPISTKQTGYGTRVNDTRTARDKYLDLKLRLQTGRGGYYETKAEILNEVGEYFGETEGSTFQEYMKDLWNATQELQKSPNGIVERTALVSTAAAFVERANEIHQQLLDYQKNLNDKIKDQVDTINSMAKDIYAINQEILKCESNGTENANDYRDGLNQILDELSKYIKIEIKEQANGTVNVYAEEHLLVAEDRTFEIGIRPVKAGSDLMNAYWVLDETDLYDLRRDIVDGDNMDTGSLKGLLCARGDYAPNYTDIPVRENYPDQDTYNQALYEYNRTLNNRDVANLMSQFDRLIHGIVKGINDILSPTITITDTNGDTYTVLDTAVAGRGYGEGNEEQGVELFKRAGMERYRDVTLTVLDEAGVPQTRVYKVLQEENPEDQYSLYTLGQIQINDVLVKNPALLPLTKVNGQENQEVVNQLLELWNKDFDTLDPNTLVMNNFNEYYSSMVGDYANKAYTYQTISDSQDAMVNEINNQRQEVIGVSSDDELTNLIKYQHAYNASSRYITVVAEMIEHIIERLG